MKTVTFFNHKGGVGKTTLVYHCAWMLSKLGYRVLAADFDPQANLSVLALPDDRLEKLWVDRDTDRVSTVYEAVKPLFIGTGDIRPVHIELLSENLGLLVGDLALSRIEDDLATEWPRCFEGRERAFRVTTVFWRVLREAAIRHKANIVLIDVSPNLGALNRAVLIASDYVVVPVAPDLFSLQGVWSFGTVLRDWRNAWQQLASCGKRVLKHIPRGQMQPVGYVLMQPVERVGRPVKAYEIWKSRLLRAYRECILNEVAEKEQTHNPHLLACIKHYHSLMPMAMALAKPAFCLTVADGAIGAHQNSVQQCWDDFEGLVKTIIDRIGGLK